MRIDDVILKFVYLELSHMDIHWILYNKVNKYLWILTLLYVATTAIFLALIRAIVDSYAYCSVVRLLLEPL